MYEVVKAESVKARDLVEGDVVATNGFLWRAESVKPVKGKRGVKSVVFRVEGVGDRFVIELPGGNGFAKAVEFDWSEEAPYYACKPLDLLKVFGLK